MWHIPLCWPEFRQTRGPCLDTMAFFVHARVTLKTKIKVKDKVKIKTKIKVKT